MAVIGAGICGLSSAYQVLTDESFNVQQLDVFADRFTSDTTSFGAAGLWRAANVHNTPREKLDRWAKASLEHAIHILSYDEDATSKGFAPAHGYLVSRKPIHDTVWKNYGLSFVVMTEEDLRRRFPHFDKDIKYGVSFSSYTLESKKFLPYLTTEIKKLGGRLIEQKLKSLDQISDKYDVIINCCGLGARELVGDDKVFGTRGQIMHIKAPWMKEFLYDIDIVDGNVSYIIPNIDHVVIGGTKQDNNYSLKPTEKDRDWILQHTTKLMPSVAKAEIVGEWVGLRPGRDEIRLETEMIRVPLEGQRECRIPVIHNYGHGANGINMSWGCAENVIELIKNHVGGMKSNL